MTEATKHKFRLKHLRHTFRLPGFILFDQAIDRIGEARYSKWGRGKVFRKLPFFFSHGRFVRTSLNRGGGPRNYVNLRELEVPADKLGTYRLWERRYQRIRRRLRVAFSTGRLSGSILSNSGDILPIDKTVFRSPPLFLLWQLGGMPYPDEISQCVDVMPLLIDKAVFEANLPHLSGSRPDFNAWIGAQKIAKIHLRAIAQLADRFAKERSAFVTRESLFTAIVNNYAGSLSEHRFDRECWSKVEHKLPAGRPRKHLATVSQSPELQSELEERVLRYLRYIDVAVRTAV